MYIEIYGINSYLQMQSVFNNWLCASLPHSISNIWNFFPYCGSLWFPTCNKWGRPCSAPYVAVSSYRPVRQTRCYQPLSSWRPPLEFRCCESDQNVLVTVTCDCSGDCVTDSMEQCSSQGACSLSAGHIPRLVCQSIYLYLKCAEITVFKEIMSVP
jgi:hypothetical protein